jgi:hypothetical protein
MTAAQLIEQSSITHVWRVLGGGDLRRGRGRAWWRRGDGWSVSLDEEHGRWFDHRDGIGGGVLDLVAHVRSGTLGDALRWLAEMRGVTLDGNKRLSREERRRFAQAHQIAPELARAAEVWYIERREELETAKAHALACEDFAALAEAAREHHRLNHLKSDGAAIIRAYLRSQQTDPTGTAALVTQGCDWRKASEALLNLLIARWARDADAAMGAAA